MVQNASLATKRPLTAQHRDAVLALMDPGLGGEFVPVLARVHPKGPQDSPRNLSHDEMRSPVVHIEGDLCFCGCPKAPGNPSPLVPKEGVALTRTLDPPTHVAHPVLAGPGVKTYFPPNGRAVGRAIRAARRDCR